MRFCRCCGGCAPVSPVSIDTNVLFEYPEIGIGRVSEQHQRQFGYGAYAPGIGVHIQSERKLAKFWLEPLALASSTRFAAHELRRLSQLVEEHREDLLGAWNEYFGD